jgi:hypothetical protein
MAKDVNGDAKATLDKLAAEYAEELNNLGVRVDALEKKVDNTKFNGELRLRYNETKFDGWDRSKDSPALFRLETTSQVNDSWVVKSRSDASYKLDDVHGSDNDYNLERAYAQGKLFGATAKLGKAGYTAANGLIWDDEMTGAQFTWNTNNLSVSIAGGVLDDGDGLISEKKIEDTNTDLASIQIGYNFNDKFGMNAGYYEINNSNLFGDKNKIWSVGADYAFNDNLKLSATYANSDLDDNKHGTYYLNTWDQVDDDAYAVTLQYKGANKADKGSFGVNVGYYDLPAKVALDPTWDGSTWDVKGWRIGTNYTVAENIVWSAWYFDGETKGDRWNNAGEKIKDGADYTKFRTQVEFFF